MCNWKKAVNCGSLLKVVINRPVGGIARSCQRGRYKEPSIHSAGLSLWWHSRTWGKDLETTAKVGFIPGIPANIVLWSHGGRAGRRQDTKDHEGMISTFCMAEQWFHPWHVGKLFWAPHEKPAQPLTWELASGGTHPTGQLNRLMQGTFHTRQERPLPHLWASVPPGPETFI